MTDRMSDEEFLQVAIEQARIRRAEGGIPIGAALVVDGQVISAERNRRVQDGGAIHHGETNALEVAGRQRATVHAPATMYTTLSPCYRVGIRRDRSGSSLRAPHRRRLGVRIAP